MGDPQSDILEQLDQLRSDPTLEPVHSLLDSLEEKVARRQLPREVLGGFVQLLEQWRADASGGRSLLDLIDQTTGGTYIQPNMQVHNLYQAQGHIFNVILDDFRKERQRLIPRMAEPLGSNFVPRPTEFGMLKSHFITEAGASPAVVAVVGGGGYGKTTLARAICLDEEIERAFPDGTLWVTFGTQPADLVTIIEGWVTALGEERFGGGGIDAAKARLREVLEGRRLLLVIDDVWVWSRSDLMPFLQGGADCARLITARDHRVLPPGTPVLSLAAMRTDEAVQVLQKGLVDAPVEPLKDLAVRLGEWPLLLTLAGGLLRKRASQQPLTDALAYVNLALDKRGIEAFDLRDSQSRNEAVALTLGISLEQLTPDEQARFAELAIFPEDVDIPLDVVINLWGESAGLDEFDSEALCEYLAQLSLLLAFDPSRRVIRLHDMVRSYLTKRLVDGAALHGRLLDAAKLPEQWRALPDEPRYFWNYLPYHLHESGRSPALYSLVTDGDFRLRQQEALDDPRATIEGLRLAIARAVNEQAFPALISCLRVFQDAGGTGNVAQSVLSSVNRGQLSRALERAELLDEGPWLGLFYHYLAWEAAELGDEPAYHRAVERAHEASAEPIPEMQDFADALQARAAARRAGAALPAPEPLADSTRDEFLTEVDNILKMLEEAQQQGDAEYASMRPFLDGEFQGYAGKGLGYRLHRLAGEAGGQTRLQHALDVVLPNRYRQYRDIALGSIGVACVAVPDPAWLRGALQRLFVRTLGDEEIPFTYDVPTLLVEECMRRGLWSTNAAPYLEQARFTPDRWGTSLRARSARAAALGWQGRDIDARQELSMALGADSGFGGFAVLHLLSAASRWVCWEGPASPNAGGLVQAARERSTHVVDGALRASRHALVDTYSQWLSQPPPSLTSVRKALAQKMPAATRHAYVDLSTAFWVFTPSTGTAIELLQLVPELLGDPMALDTVLARVLGLQLSSIPDNEVQQALIACQGFFLPQ